MTTEELTAALRCFLPTVEIIDGCFIRTDDFPDSSAAQAVVREWLAELSGERRAVERMINHVHLVELVPWTEGEYTSADLELIGFCYKTLVEHRLRELFPNQVFNVELYDDPQQGIDEIAVTFCLAPFQPP